MMQTAPPRPRPTLPPSERPKPTRSNFTDHLLYTWKHLRPTQRDTAWQMVETMRATMAAERRQRAVITFLLLLAGLAAVVLAYLLVTAPVH